MRKLRGLLIGLALLALGIGVFALMGVALASNDLLIYVGADTYMGYGLIGAIFVFMGRYKLKTMQKD